MNHGLNAKTDSGKVFMSRIQNHSTLNIAFTGQSTSAASSAQCSATVSALLD